MNDSAFSFEPLIDEYNRIEKHIDTTAEQLKNDCETMIQENAVFEKVHSGHLFGSVVLLTLSAAAMTYGKERIPEWLEKVISSQEILTQVLECVKLLCIGMIVLQAYNIFKSVYFMKLFRHRKSVQNIIDEMKNRADNMKNERYYTHLATAIGRADAAFSAGQENDLGDRILAFHKNFAKFNRRASVFRKISGIIISVILYGFGIWMLLKHKEQFSSLSESSVFWAILSGAYLLFMIDVIMISVGGYLGKFMKPLGCVLVAVYGVLLFRFLHPLLEGLTLADGKIPEPVGKFVTAGNVILFLQLMGMLTGVLSANYLAMQQGWRNGFTLTMLYGQDKQKTRVSLIIRLLLSSVLMGITWHLCRTEAFTLWLPFLWWVSTPLMKPFGSTIYTFYGRGKCISMELTCLGWMLLYLIQRDGELSMITLYNLGISFIGYLILGAIAKKLNDDSEFFEFTYHFI